jgi:KDO2-lipid IV(A) lauroyltransferase
MKKIWKKIWKKIRPARYFIGGVIYTPISIIFAWTPLFILYGFADFIGNLAFFTKTKSIRRMGENLSYAYGDDKDPKELSRIARQVCVNLPRGFMESFRVIYRPPENIAKTVEITGLEHLDNALAKGKGVIVISAHIGNFFIFGPALGSAGYPYNVVVKDSPNPIMAKVWRKGQINSLNRPIRDDPPIECVKNILRKLRAGEIVALLVDEDRAQGIPVEFFGKPAYTPTGPAVLSQRSGAALVPMFAIREGRNRHRIIIEPAGEFELGDDKGENIATITTWCTRTVENMIRRYPGQWTWFNPRWKTYKRRLKKGLEIS